MLSTFPSACGLEAPACLRRSYVYGKKYGLILGVTKEATFISHHNESDFPKFHTLLTGTFGIHIFI